MPNFSPLHSASSGQSSRTSQPPQTPLASRVDAPRSGKKRSGSTPRQFARSCQRRSPESAEPAPAGPSAPGPVPDVAGGPPPRTRVARLHPPNPPLTPHPAPLRSPQQRPGPPTPPPTHPPLGGITLATSHSPNHTGEMTNLE